MAGPVTSTPPRCPDERALRAAARIAARRGEDRVVDDPDILEGYGSDESGLPPSPPAAAVRARDREDVLVTLEVAAELDVPVTPRAGGTGKSGGAIPVCGGLVLDTSRLDRVVEIDRESLLAVAGPGVKTGALHAAVEAEGLFYPPDPASLETCAIGGNVAENAGGPRAFKYGVTGSYVLGAEVVLPGGRALRVGRRTVKGVAGYDVTSLLVGSEGTLGVFTEVTLRLVPRPRGARTLLALFDDPVRAGRAVTAVVGAGLRPRVIELLDATCVDTVRAAHKLPIPARAGALLLLEVDGEPETLEAQALRLAETCEAGGALEVLAMQTEAESRALWAARRELSELLGRRLGHKLADDVAVPLGAISSMIDRARRIAEAEGVRSAVYGHAGDGNLHLNVLWQDEAQAEAAARAMEATVAAAVEAGGTITGEHGVGLAKRHLIGLEQPRPLLDLQRALKAVFDPRGILNPGKIFP